MLITDTEDLIITDNFNYLEQQGSKSPVKFRDFGDNSPSGQRWQVSSPQKIKPFKIKF
jgi:hypothetical protein